MKKNTEKKTSCREARGSAENTEHLPRAIFPVGECYFAAANGYDGFRSSFGSVFRSEDHTRIYVLKGGPGTGKSTFLKKCAEYGEQIGVRTLRIHCSSDPASLDGVIFLPRGKRRIALLDGTAPHERDAVIAGAVDRLIDLGAYRDDDALLARRAEILRLDTEKKAEYKKAYDALNISGLFARKVHTEIRSRIPQNAARAYAEDLLLRICGESGEKVRRSAHALPDGLLLDAFGKDGHIRIESQESGERRFDLCGREAAAHTVIACLLRLCEDRGIGCYAFRSAFDEASIDAIRIPVANAIVRVNGEGGEPVEADGTMREKGLLKDAELALLEEEAARFSALARHYFAHASEKHFAIEKIYSAAMDFDGVARETQRMIQSIEKEIC